MTPNYVVTLGIGCRGHPINALKVFSAFNETFGRTFYSDRFQVLTSFLYIFTTVDILFVLSGLISTVRSLKKILKLNDFEIRI